VKSTLTHTSKKRFCSLSNLPEILSLRTLQSHPNIVRLLDIFFNPETGELSLFFELLDINLSEYLKEFRSPLDEATTLLFIYQLLKVVSFLHRKNLFYRDIKPENCVLNRHTLELKLVDFGSFKIDSLTPPYTEYIST
jgi:serine/threonine protein kinase